MRIYLPIGILASVVLAVIALASQPGTAAQPPPPPPVVKVGDPAPDFTLRHLDVAKEGDKPERKQIRLADFKGKKNVVLAFFPAAFSPG